MIVFFSFFFKIKRSLAALIHKIFCQLQMFLILSNGIQADKSHFQDFMAGIALHFSGFRTKISVYQIHIADDSVEEFVLTGSFIIRHSAFCHMSQAVHFVVVPQVCPTFIQPVDNIVCIQVTIGLLGGADQVDNFIGRFFKLRIRMGHEGIGYGFQPFKAVAVLENAAVEIALFQPRGYPEVFNPVAGFRIRQAVVQRFPLIRNNFLSGKLHIASPEGIGDFDVLWGNRVCKVFRVHFILPFIL